MIIIYKQTCPQNDKKTMRQNDNATRRQDDNATRRQCDKTKNNKTPSFQKKPRKDDILKMAQISHHTIFTALKY